MNFEAIEKIANAVLYEGYMLYPYRKSSVKNQKRWHFGTLSAPGGADPSSMQTECLVEVDRNTSVEARIRFLRGEIETVIDLGPFSIADPPLVRGISFPPVEGKIEVAVTSVEEDVWRLTIRISNTSSGSEQECAMLSTHTLLGVNHGSFLSMIDPPEQYRPVAAACRNIGTWPVLAGREGDRGLILSSPIILYDYPQIAPESAGDLFDGTEIDEILTLRVLTLSEDEKSEVRSGDNRAREILHRTEMLPSEALAKMHGAIRGLRNASKLQFREGDRVRLHPRRKADIFDIALEGKVAIVESVETDFEDRVHLAVTVEDDPGRDFGVARQIGHRFFFAPEEVELV